MKYIAVCRDVFGNIIEMKFGSQQELTDFTMRPSMQVLFTFEREEGNTYLISSSVSSCIHTSLKGV